MRLGQSTLPGCVAGHLLPDAGQVFFAPRAKGPKGFVTMSEPQWRMAGAHRLAFVVQQAHDGLARVGAADGPVGDDRHA